jgi:hypothetical protein
MGHQLTPRGFFCGVINQLPFAVAAPANDQYVPVRLLLDH